MFGGMTYENPAIQQAIDSVFIAQQDKEKSAAALAAQRDINAKSDSAAQQEKANVITLAKANAEGAKIKAEGEADAIKSVADAAKDAASNPTFLELRKLEIEAARYAKWNGQLPQTVTILGEGEKTSIMLTK
jgi:regulator of protease activity HflC (stomatin/prohibitin superfamily)